MAKQYYNYNPENRGYVDTNYYEEQPLNSVDFAPSIENPELNAVLNSEKTEWVDVRTAEQQQKALVPELVSRRQLKLQLILSGFNVSLIDGVINQLPEPNKSIALVAWNDAGTFVREDPLLVALASQLGLSDVKLDEIFINASKL